MSNRLQSRHSIAAGGLSSLRLTSNLAAAVFSGLGQGPLPGVFKFDPAQFEEEIKIAKRIRRKQRVIGCFKKFVAFFFSHVGLLGSVIFYSLVGGFMFQHIEREQEIADKHRFSQLKYRHINNTLEFFIQRLDQLDRLLLQQNQQNETRTSNKNTSNKNISTDPATTTLLPIKTTATRTSSSLSSSSSLSLPSSSSSSSSPTTTMATSTTKFLKSKKFRYHLNSTSSTKSTTTHRTTTDKPTTTTSTKSSSSSPPSSSSSPTTTTESPYQRTAALVSDMRATILDEGSTRLTQSFREFQTEVTDAVKSGGWDGKDKDTEGYQWSFPGALLYAVTVITTIGYGHIAPKTKLGRLLTIGYALIGIPLTFLYLSNIGNFLGESLKRICCGVCCCMQCKRRKDREMLRLRRKQRFLTARQEFGMSGECPADVGDLSGGLQDVPTEKESLLSPSEKHFYDKDFLSAFHRPSSSTNTSISLSSADRAALFVSLKNEENQRFASPMIGNDQCIDSQVKFGCNVTITPPDDDKSRITSRDKKHRPSLTLEASRFSPTPIQEEFHIEDFSPKKQSESRKSIKRLRTASKKKNKMLVPNLSKRFEDLEETAILSDDCYSPTDEIKETSIIDDYNSATHPNKPRDIHKRTSNMTKANSGDGTDRKACIKFDTRTSHPSQDKNKTKKTFFIFDDKNDMRRFASLEMLPVDISEEKPKRMSKGNEVEIKGACLKRVDTAPVGTGCLILNNSIEAPKKSNSSKRNLKKISPPIKSKYFKESGDRDQTKIAASSHLIGQDSTNKHPHSFNENLKSKRKSRTEFDVSTSSLRRTRTMPTHSSRSKREAKLSLTSKAKPLQVENQAEEKHKTKSKKKQAMLNSCKFRSDFDVVRTYNSYNNKIAGNYLLPPRGLKSRYLGRARNASFSQEVITSALKNSERRVPINQIPVSIPSDKINDATSGLRTRPASVIGLKSLSDLRNQAAIQSRSKNDQLQSTVSYIMLQPPPEEYATDRQAETNQQMDEGNFPAVASPSDLFLPDNPLLDFDDDDLKDQNHDHKVPIYVCLIIITGYISGGAMLFCTWEKWDYIASSYFCFITLSTIGFGDIVPGTDVNKWASHEKLVLCTLWLAVGLSLLAMCFNLMQESVKERFRRFGRRIGLLKSQNGTI